MQAVTLYLSAKEEHFVRELKTRSVQVCVAFQYASVLGGLLIMLFSAFVCTGGLSRCSESAGFESPLVQDFC